jgi:O-antigen/teichoic acid export membrane protein
VNAAVAATTVSASPELPAVVSHARLLGLSQVIRRAFRMGVLLLAARMLGVEMFGSYVLLLTVVEMVALISGYAYMDFLTREIAQHPESAWPLGRRIIELRLAWTLAGLGLALFTLAALGFSSALVINTALLGITLLPRAFTESAQGVMKGLRRFTLLPWIELGQGALVLVAAPLMILSGFALRGMITAEIVGAAGAAAVAVTGVARYRRSGLPATLPMTDLLRRTYAFNIYPFLTSLYDRVDVVLLAKLAGNVATGIYSLPYRAFATLQIIPYGIMGALLPVLSASSTARDRRETCARTMKLLLLTALTLVLLTLTFAGAALGVLLGREYAGSVGAIEVLIWATIPAFLNFALNTLLISEKREQIFLRTTAVCTAFNVAANLLLIPRYSYMGAAVVTVLTECLLLLQNILIVRRAVGQTVFPAEGLKLLAAFATALAVFWIFSSWGHVWAGSLASSTFLLLALPLSGGFRSFSIVAEQHR